MDKPVYDMSDNLLNEEDLDLEAGFLIDDMIEVTVPAVEAVEEEWHYEYKTYPNGGKERWKVVDVPGVEACDEHKEMKPCYRYHLHPTEPEFFEDPGPSQLDRVEAQALYTALMTDTILPEELEEEEVLEPVGADADTETDATTDADGADSIENGDPASATDETTEA